MNDTPHRAGDKVYLCVGGNDYLEAEIVCVSDNGRTCDLYVPVCDVTAYGRTEEPANQAWDARYGTWRREPVPAAPPAASNGASFAAHLAAAAAQASAAGVDVDDEWDWSWAAAAI